MMTVQLAPHVLIMQLQGNVSINIWDEKENAAKTPNYARLTELKPSYAVSLDRQQSLL